MLTWFPMLGSVHATTMFREGDGDGDGGAGGGVVTVRTGEGFDDPAPELADPPHAATAMTIPVIPITAAIDLRII
ncbi:MAG TPA: hypothetical protein VH637_21750 [Streptosporangiaceae bacterium]